MLSVRESVSPAQRQFDQMQEQHRRHLRLAETKPLGSGHSEERSFSRDGLSHRSPSIESLHRTRARDGALEVPHRASSQPLLASNYDLNEDRESITADRRKVPSLHRRGVQTSQNSWLHAINSNQSQSSPSTHRFSGNPRNGHAEMEASVPPLRDLKSAEDTNQLQPESKSNALQPVFTQPNETMNLDCPICFDSAPQEVEENDDELTKRQATDKLIDVAAHETAAANPKLADGQFDFEEFESCSGNSTFINSSEIELRHSLQSNDNSGCLELSRSEDSFILIQRYYSDSPDES